MPGPAPNPNSRTRHKPTFSWVDLDPAGRCGPPPKLPGWHRWQPATRKWWGEMWAKPQATQWEPDGSTMVPFALLMDDLHSGRVSISTVSAEIRQHQDRHGLNPKAMLQLRWRLSTGSDVESTAPVAVGQVVPLRRGKT